MHHMRKEAKKEPTFLAVIPARSGSKGIPNKNIRPFCGKPLMYYSVSEALKCERINRVIVSTDSENYAEIAKKYGAEVPFLRPKEFATDTSPIFDTIKHLLITLRAKENYIPNYIVILQTTSPLRTTSDVNRCIDVILETHFDAVITVCQTEQLLYTINGDGVLKLIHKKSWLDSTNRQMLPTTYKINGPAVLVVNAKSIFKKGNRSLVYGRVFGVIMEKWLSPDIDAKEDWVVAELLYKNRKMIAKKMKT